MASISETLEAANDLATTSVFGFETDVLYIGYATVPFTAGLRFQTIGITKGEKINSAYLYLSVESYSGEGSISTNVYGVDEGDLLEWSDPDNLPEDAATTDAFTLFEPPDVPDVTYQINVTEQVQEIVNLAFWFSGNDMGFVIVDNLGGVGGEAAAILYERGDVLEPVLEINFGANPEKIMLTGVG